MSSFDWSKAGKRLRHQPRTVDGNPDWNWVEQRWKDEADYYADDLTSEKELIAAAGCPHCGVAAGEQCIGPGILEDMWHGPRKRAAGEAMLAERGPRFSK